MPCTHKTGCVSFLCLFFCVRATSTQESWHSTNVCLCKCQKKSVSTLSPLKWTQKRNEYQMRLHFSLYLGAGLVCCVSLCELWPLFETGEKKFDDTFVKFAISQRASRCTSLSSPSFGHRHPHRRRWCLCMCKCEHSCTIKMPNNNNNENIYRFAQVK